MKLTLIKKRVEAKGTKSFFWKSEKPVKYLPGQFFYYTLPSILYPDPRGATRHFTLSSSPTEGELLRLTTRIRNESGFKRSLDKLEIGSIIEGEGPSGTFILDESDLSAQAGKGQHILLAGGIGITPFRSFIKYAIDKGLRETQIQLIYSNSQSEEIAFREELENWSKENENIKVYLTVTSPTESKEKWSGLTGRIDEKMITSLIPKQYTLNATFWLCGSAPMVEAMEKILGSLKITSDKLRSEKFTGY